MQTTVNIGLVRSETSRVYPKGPLDVAAVLDSVRSLWGSNVKAWAHTSDSEPTLVIETASRVTLEALAALSVALDQDCIAAFNWDTKRGFMAGPKASLWGPFNADYFLTPGGVRLSEVLALAA